MGALGPGATPGGQWLVSRNVGRAAPLNAKQVPDDEMLNGVLHPALRKTRPLRKLGVAEGWPTLLGRCRQDQVDQEG